MRRLSDVMLWTLIITDVAVICTVGYYRYFVSPELYGPILLHAITIAAGLGASLGFLGCLQIMMGQNQHHALRRMNDTDTLTGLHTRARFFTDARSIDIPRCSVLMIDVDRFKSINDTYGHQCGDEVLVQTARRLGSICRTGDVLARYGGEEFIVCLPVTSLRTAKRCAERFRLAVGAVDVTLRDRTFPVTISIGLASGAAGETIDGLIARADKALLLAKSAGRNTVVTEEDFAVLDPDSIVRRMRRTSRF
ncbi:MAG: GGDEF domain-containing protein [Silicimonas sp.]